MKLDIKWWKLGEAYPILTKQAHKVLVSFVTTYLCESGLLVPFSIKSKEAINKKPNMTCFWLSQKHCLGC
jgi:hypothetical protein